MCQGNIDDEQHWSNMFQQELIRHLTVEELVLYRLFEKYLDLQGNNIIDQCKYKHQYMKKQLFLLETTPITDTKYCLTFYRLIKKFV
ncbi:unnamed protein product [Rotaria sp. Silwood1]|nr:unnamed protein product [Rotaria sp. Silwood1]CAF1502426.1 unnamed protein product [Rotaria sp. Silwood1]